MIRDVARMLRGSWTALVLTDVLFKIVAFVLLTPLLSLVFRAFLAVSGRTVLADADIAKFLLHPIGWLAVIVVGGVGIAILALEQSALMIVSLAAMHGRRLSVLPSLRMTAARAPGILRIAWRMVARALLLAAPFLAVGGGLYLWLLTDHDINFYLTRKPPRFWFAVASIGSVLAVLVFLLVRCVIAWAIAIQLYLFEDVPPGQCLSTSRDRLIGHRRTIARWIVIWFVANTLLSSVATAVVLWLGQGIVPAAAGSLWQLVLSLGLVLLLWGLVNVVMNLLAVISFAVMQSHVYDRFGRTPAFHLPDEVDAKDRWSLRLTRGRVVSALAVAALVAALIGTTAIHTVRLDDEVAITAHRGASGRAPENTLASVRAAIEDGTDWVEIDVQESQDGVVVVAHDSDLKKVSGNSVKIWEATAEELRAIDIGSYFGSEFADQRVPTLAEVLETCRGRVNLNIELKYYGHDQNLEQKVVDLVEEHGMADNVVIMSLEAAGIAKIKQLRPSWTVGLLTAVVVGDLTRAEADFLAVSSKIASRGFITSAQRQGKDVFVWTVNDPFSMSTMISRGADNLITDHPALARQVLQERAEMSPMERMLVELAFLFGAAPTRNPEQ